MDDAYAYEIAAERAALHKAVHAPVRAWYATRPDLAALHGAFPLFWKDLATWAPFKDVYRLYSRWSEGGVDEPAAATAAATAAPAPSAAESSTAAAPVDAGRADDAAVQGAARKRKRWSEAPDAAEGGGGAAGATSAAPAEDDAAATKPRQRQKQRWTVDADLTLDGKPPMAPPTFRSRTRFGSRILPAAMTLLPPGASVLQEVLFVTRVQVDEVAARVLLLPAELKRIEEAGPDGRSPSPEAEYDSTGKRLNSREQRMRKALGEARDALLERLMDLNPTVCSGASGPRFSRKIYIPWREYPSYNFMGLIIGPRGNTQKHLEKNTNCKISVRGRGAKGPVSETSMPPPALAAPESAAMRRKREDEEDDLHVHITAERLSELEACVSLITDILKPMDDESSEIKKLQLMQLALVNGTLRDLNAPCHSCGEVGHRSYECPYREAQMKKANVRCAICGDASHVTADCKLKKTGGAAPGAAADDSEYLSFMAEMGDTNAQAVVANQARMQQLLQQKQQLAQDQAAEKERAAAAAASAGPNGTEPSAFVDVDDAPTTSAAGAGGGGVGAAVSLPAPLLGSHGGGPVPSLPPPVAAPHQFFPAPPPPRPSGPPPPPPAPPHAFSGGFPHGAPPPPYMPGGFYPPPPMAYGMPYGGMPPYGYAPMYPGTYGAYGYAPGMMMVMPQQQQYVPVPGGAGAGVEGGGAPPPPPLPPPPDAPPPPPPDVPPPPPPPPA